MSMQSILDDFVAHTVSADAQTYTWDDAHDVAAQTAGCTDFNVERLEDISGLNITKLKVQKYLACIERLSCGSPNPVLKIAAKTNRTEGTPLYAITGTVHSDECPEGEPGCDFGLFYTSKEARAALARLKASKPV